MISFSLPIKPLSLNMAYRGRRFDSSDKKTYDRSLAILLPHIVCPGPYYKMTYRFHMRKCWLSDLSNIIKVLEDNIVDRGIIRNDRYVSEIHCFKYPSKTDRIEVEIESVTI